MAIDISQCTDQREKLEWAFRYLIKLLKIIQRNFEKKGSDIFPNLYYHTTLKDLGN